LRECRLDDEIVDHILVCNPFERRLEEHDEDDVSYSESDGEMDFEVEQPLVCEDVSDEENTKYSCYQIAG
jgi:hypothetical protein